MKTLSNSELQDAIEHTVRLIKGDGSRSSVILTVHLEALTDEQRRRATDELTLEPMTTTLERAEFDARVEAQDGPEWVLSRPLAPHQRELAATKLADDLLNAPHAADGQMRRIQFKRGPLDNEVSHGGLDRDSLIRWFTDWLSKNWGGL